jgi:hypothetical protein
MQEDYPMMTASELRVEAELDEMAAYDGYYDDDFGPEPDEWVPCPNPDCIEDADHDGGHSLRFPA